MVPYILCIGGTLVEQDVGICGLASVSSDEQDDEVCDQTSSAYVEPNV
jgi:hypothetical protein